MFLFWFKVHISFVKSYMNPINTKIIIILKFLLFKSI